MQRLKTRAQFQAVLAGGTLARTPHFALHCVAIGAERLPLFPVADHWLGAMVPKRWAKRAVTRNAIKRQVYVQSLAAPLQAPAEWQAYLVRLRSGFDRKQFVSASSEALKLAVRQELIQLFDRASGQRARATVPARPVASATVAGAAP